MSPGITGLAFLPIGVGAAVCSIISSGTILTSPKPESAVLLGRRLKSIDIYRYASAGHWSAVDCMEHLFANPLNRSNALGPYIQNGVCSGIYGDVELFVRCLFDLCCKRSRYCEHVSEYLWYIECSQLSEFIGSAAYWPSSAWEWLSYLKCGD